MSWAEAIKSANVEEVENLLKSGADVSSKIDGEAPLSLLRDLIKDAIDKGEFKREEDLKYIASILVVKGANIEDFGHECGEVSEICTSINRYILINSVKHGESSKVKEMIEDEKIWFKSQDDKSELFRAIELRDLDLLNTLIESERVNFAFNQ
jgi:hypothetical protein